MRSLILIAGLALTACAEDLVAQLDSQCAAAPTSCSDATASGLLYLDTGNLPSTTGQSNCLVLCATPPSPTCATTGLELIFEGGPLTADIDPTLAGQSDWKVQFDAADLQWVEAQGRTRISARLRNLNFIHDVDDDRDLVLAID